MTGKRPVVVVGGGWAGLAACVALVDAGLPVLLLEATRALGGRARSVRFENLWVDNGQHILLGAYRSVLELLARVGVAESDAFLRLPLMLQIRSPADRTISLRVRPLPPPAGLGLGMLMCSGLAIGERVRGALAGARLLRSGTSPGTVAELLETTGQPQRIRKAIWEPLCLAALNTPPETASAKLYRDVLRSALLGPRDASDLLLPRQPLAALLPEPALSYIQNHGARVRVGTPVRDLHFHNAGLGGVHTDDEAIEASHVILAAQPKSTARLLQPWTETTALSTVINQSREHDITTVYLRYADHAAIDPPIQGVLGCQTQWLIDRRSCGQPGVFAAVISASDTGKPPSARETAAELSRVFPELGEPEDSLSVRERRATFAATSNFELLRPNAKTDIPGLYLAGDWTDTGLPGTLEGAVISGQLAARDVIAAYERAGSR